MADHYNCNEVTAMEKFIYEIRPYFYLTTGGSALINGTAAVNPDWHMVLLAVSGSLLMIAAAVIVKLRLDYRSILSNQFAHLNLVRRRPERTDDDAINDWVNARVKSKKSV